MRTPVKSDAVQPYGRSLWAHFSTGKSGGGSRFSRREVQAREAEAEQARETLAQLRMKADVAGQSHANAVVQLEELDGEFIEFYSW